MKRPVADTLRNIFFWGGALFKILKFESQKWHLQRSENTFCKKLGFQNTVLMVRFVINHMPSHAQKHITIMCV
jgi:hypothetical protein